MEKRKLIAFVGSVRWSEELSFRANHRYMMSGKTWSVRLVPWQLWMIMSNSHFMWSSHFALLTLGVNQNLLVLFIELMVAKCFYLSGNLFPGFGYGKPKRVFTIICSYTWYMKLRFEAYLVLYEWICELARIF